MTHEYEGLSPSFARARRQVDEENRRRPPVHRKEERHDATLSTVEAVMYELRTDGVAALKSKNCQRRLGDLSRPQIEELLRRLIALRGRPYCPGIDDELLAYIEGLAK
jgi:hypothetical protein